MCKLLFIIAIVSSIHLCAQDDKRPSNKEIQQQMKGAIADAKKQREDAKRKLEEAKANHDDPESIKQLEDQFAMLDNMISQLEKVDPLANMKKKTLPVSKTKEPAFVSPFIPVSFKSPVIAPTEKEAKDQLLWYKGKFIAPKTLVTTTGMIVQYDARNHKLIFEPSHKPGPDTIYYGFVQTLRQTWQIKSVFASRVNGMMNSFFMYPQIKAAYDDVGLMSDRFYDLANNTINLPRTPGLPVSQLIQQLDAYINSIPGIKQIIDPPPRPNKSCLCEIPEEVVKYENDLTSWLKNFFKEELEITGQVDDIAAAIEDLKSNGVRDIPEFFYSQYIFVAFMRANYKLELLLKEYQASNLESILVEDALVYAKKNLDHLENIYDLKSLSPPPDNTYSNGQNLFKEVNRAVLSKKFEEYIDVNKQLENYNVVFDYGLYLSHEYNKRILNSGYDVNGKMEKWLEGLKDFNRFTLYMKLDFFYQIGEEGGDIFMNADGAIESDKIIVSLAIHDCNWEFYITDVDYRNRNTTGKEFRFPMKITGGTKDYMKDKLGPFSYTGPQEITMVVPNFNISFCGDKSTALFQSLHYSTEDLVKHNKDNAAIMYTTDMQDFANEMFISVEAAKENASKIISTSITMMNLGNHQMSQSTGDQALDYLNEEFTMNRKKYDLQYSLNQNSQTAKALVELNKPSNAASNVVFDASVELAKKNDKDKTIARHLVHGGLKISLIHTPK